MVKWSAKVHGKALCILFDKKLANPKLTKADEIDSFQKLDPSFNDIDLVRFRSNFRNTAANYMRGNALKGIRREIDQFNCVFVCYT